MRLAENFNLYDPCLQIRLNSLKPTNKATMKSQVTFEHQLSRKFHVITFWTSDKSQAGLTIEQPSGFEKGLHGLLN